MRNRKVVYRLPLWILLTLLLGRSVPASPEAVARDVLRRLALPLEHADDLGPLLERMGEARLVLLGEASHGTSEFYTWRREISRRLVAEHGFDFIAVEGDWAPCQELNRYVKDQPGAAGGGREIMEGFSRWPTWMWSNAETLELIEWLRAFNRERPPARRIGFHGIDVYGAEQSLTAMMQMLSGHDPGLARELEVLYGDFAGYLPAPRLYLQALATGAEPFTERVGRAVALLEERTAEWPAAQADRRFDLLQCATVIRAAEAHYREMAQRDAASWNRRADHFHDTVVRLLAHYGPASRGIVWAHNTHIGDARATTMVQAGKRNIGQLAREGMGMEAVVAVGFGTWRGRVTAGRQWGGERLDMPLPPGRPGSYEALMATLGMETALFIFPSVNRPGALLAERGHRAVGVVYHPEREAGNYVPTRLLDRYDAFIFIRETKALDYIGR